MIGGMRLGLGRRSLLDRDVDVDDDVHTLGFGSWRFTNRVMNDSRQLVKHFLLLTRHFAILGKAYYGSGYNRPNEHFPR